MATRESALWIWLSQARKTYQDDLVMNRIENKIMAGMPDVEGCLRGTQFWLELKCGDIPVREMTTLSIRVESSQVEFAESRLKAGGACGILLKAVGRGAHYIFLIHGKHARALRAGLTLNEIKELSMLIRGKPYEYISEARELKL